MKAKQTKVTTHGQERVRKRIGLSKQAILRNAQKARYLGKQPHQVKGEVRDWMIWKVSRSGREHITLYLYGQYAYAFDNEVLVTAFLVPPKIRRAMRKARQ